MAGPDESLLGHGPSAAGAAGSRTLSADRPLPKVLELYGASGGCRGRVCVCVSACASVRARHYAVVFQGTNVRAGQLFGPSHMASSSTSSSVIVIVVIIIIIVINIS